jgi:hypothetical protein
MISQDLLISSFDYLNGHLYRKSDNKKMGCKSDSGSKIYIKIWFSGKLYFAHQLIFLWHHGYIPKTIDHIDGNGLNNNIENLRAVSVSQNTQNAPKRKTNTSGYKGVYWRKKDQVWSAQITVNYKCKNLGRFQNKEDAYLAYQQAAAKYHTTNPEALNV